MRLLKAFQLLGMQYNLFFSVASICILFYFLYKFNYTIYNSEFNNVFYFFTCEIMDQKQHIELTKSKRKYN